MTDFSYATATELAPLIQSRQISPVELTNHLLQRIHQFDSSFKTFITPTYDLALAQARQAEQDIMRGQYKGPLHGIPIGIKDNFYTEGIRTTVGSALFRDFVPNMTSTAAKRLLSAGTILLGKLNLHELALGSTGTNPYYGTTRNPWNPRYMPGGSSGGSSAALAAGLATITTGTDTFGSIRQPSALCGTYGLKPTYGLVSTFGVFPSAMSLDTAGPMTRSVTDLALMMNYMAGYDPNDPTSLQVKIPDYAEDLEKGIKGITIGVPTYYMKGLDRDVEVLFNQAMDTLKGLGANVREITIPELELSTFAGYAIVGGEASNTHHEWLQSYPNQYSQDIRSFLLAGALTNANTYVRAQQARRKMVKAFDQAFQEVDVLLGPTTPYTTPMFSKNWVKQNLDIVRRSMPFTVPVNLAGLPGLAVPMGRCSKGLPVGMQFIGKHLSEKFLFQVGRAWEKTNPLSFRP